ncbi:MAG: prepilin-type N-terminal cleavage/methylation domain-containing protein [Alphaproteobacteria bacterium]|nr:prepilin-type N-terminal cleavage/methylation domain-containing protein [Alphaproteobacteria bacterium]
MRGFSLVELSIVLVILGLLTGGILAGQSLIRASELRAVSTEYQRYVAATQTFRDKYFAIPGDFNSATRFWQRMTNTADCITNSSAAVNSAGSCDGDGDATFDGSAANQSTEAFQYWRQLALAGLVEGTYSGLSGGAASGHVVATNAPKSKFGQSYWSVGTYSSLSGHASIFDRTGTGQLFQFGGLHASAGNRVTVFKPEEAWNIDSKMDDGRPAVGKFRVRTNEDTYVISDCTTAATTADLNANYALSRTDVTCTALLMDPF